MKRLWALFMARNYEFIRDRAGFGWNILFPFLIVAGFGIIFSSDTRSDYKIGVFPAVSNQVAIEELTLPEKLQTYQYIKFIPFKNKEQAMDQLLHHKVDILIQAKDPTEKQPVFKYWISDSSPKGYIIEKVVKESLVDESVFKEKVIRKEIDTVQIRYIDWLFPGILGMNIMFSSLFGVGYVIVRYRRSGVLKRLKATPVTAFEYLSAQMISRVMILMCTSFFVWFGCDFIFSFQMQGSYIDAAIVFLAGTICLVCLGLVFACRGTNEELTNGFINFFCWPMMFLSEVWFSIEGSSEWVKTVSSAFPLTHFLSAVRKIINDGAVLSDVFPELGVLLIMSLVFLSIGSVFFSWTK